MVEIGGRPILWHIMKIFGSHGINDFVICCGYKGYMIKEYFANYFLHMSDVTFDLENNLMEVHQRYTEPWRVTLIDTGELTMTGGRLKRVSYYIKNEDAFCFTYGDGVASIDIGALVAFHRSHGRLATVTAVRPPGRYGSLDLCGDIVSGFVEKPVDEGGWVNGGYFVLSPKAIGYIENDLSSWEGAPLQALARAGEFRAFLHRGFWQPMDTLRDKLMLEELWSGNRAPWRAWR
jgi:glucose-1-phosphate cytidylyltransferase